MIKNITAALAACLYVALSAWLVGSVGRVHRDALDRSRKAQAVPVSSSPAEEARREAEVPGRDLPSQAAQSDRMDEPQPPPIARAPLPSSPPSPAESPGRTVAPAPAKPAPTETSSPATAKAEVVKPAAPRLEDLDRFFGLPQAKKKWDLNQLNAEQEMKLGRELNEMVLLPRFNRRLMKGSLERRLNEAAEPLLAALARKEINYRFIVLDSKVVNAFSHPGGYVYVTSGLLDWISVDENYALQFALAHEIYHVDRQHALTCLKDANVRKLPYGTLTLFYLLIFPRGYYPEQMDFADAWALHQLQKLGCTRRECLMFIRRWEGYAEDNNFLMERALPESGKVASLFDNHYRAHPSALTRLKKLESLVAQPPVKPR